MTTIIDHVHHPDGTVTERKLGVETLLTKEQARARQAAYEAAAHNAPILARLDANDLRALRAIVEGDTARIEAHKLEQAELRKQLRKTP